MGKQPDQILPAPGGWYAYYSDPTLGTWHLPVIAWAVWSDGRMLPVVADVNRPGSGSIDEYASDLIYSPNEVPKDTDIAP